MIYIGVLIIVISPPPPPESAPSPVQEQPIVQERPRMQRRPGMIYMTCERCEWIGEYDNMASAKMGAAGHRGACKKGRGRRKKSLF